MSTRYTVEFGAGDQLEIQVSPWTGTKLFYQGQQLKKGWFSPKFQLTGSDGQNHDVRLQSNFIDALPKIVIDGQVKEYAPPLPGWAWLIIGGAILQAGVSIILLGGWLGAIPGLVAMFYAQNAIRGNEDSTTGAMIAIGYVVAAWVIWAIWSFVVLAILYATG